MPLDRRQHDRVRAPRILVRVPTIDKLRTHYLRDLSAGGLFIRTAKMLPVNTEVEVELVPPGLDKPLSLSARVVRQVNDEASRVSGTSGIGVRFENLYPEADRALAALIAECTETGEPSVTALRLQVQSLALELAAVRQTLADREGELQTLQVEIDRQIAERQATERQLHSATAKNEELEGLLREAALAKQQHAVRDLQVQAGDDMKVASNRSLIEAMNEAAPSPERDPLADWVGEDGAAEPSPPTEAAPAKSPALDDGFIIDVADGPLDIPAANNAKVVDFSPPPPGRVSDYAEFQRHFMSGARIKRTDRFHLHTPTDPYEVLISGLLETADNLAGLRTLAAGRASDERIGQVVFRLYVKSLVEWDGPPPAEAGASAV